MDDFENWLKSEEAGIMEYKLFPERGIYAGIRRLVYHYTMIVGEIGDKDGYLKRYCYQTEVGAIKAMNDWDGTGDPEGWHRAPETGRRRPDGDAKREYIGW